LGLRRPPPVFDRTGGVDGRVSIEVDPRVAHDTAKTVAEARALQWLIARPNVMIEIAATAAGLGAITAATAAGISVDVTLVFGLKCYAAVIDAYLRGLEQAATTGVDLTTIRSVASLFVSRVDTEMDARLNRLGTVEAQALRGNSGITNAGLAYEHDEAVIGSPRWRQLEAGGATRQRPLWASTGVKNPAYPDTMYVTQLVAPDTVNTMPEATLTAVADHAQIGTDTIQSKSETGEPDASSWAPLTSWTRARIVGPPTLASTGLAPRPKEPPLMSCRTASRPTIDGRSSMRALSRRSSRTPMLERGRI